MNQTRKTFNQLLFIALVILAIAIIVSSFNNVKSNKDKDCKAKFGQAYEYHMSARADFEYCLNPQNGDLKAP